MSIKGQNPEFTTIDSLTRELLVTDPQKLLGQLKENDERGAEIVGSLIRLLKLPIYEEKEVKKFKEVKNKVPSAYYHPLALTQVLAQQARGLLMDIYLLKKGRIASLHLTSEKVFRHIIQLLHDYPRPLVPLHELSKIISIFAVYFKKESNVTSAVGVDAASECQKILIGIIKQSSAEHCRALSELFKDLNNKKLDLLHFHFLCRWAEHLELQNNVKEAANKYQQALKLPSMAYIPSKKSIGKYFLEKRIVFIALVQILKRLAAPEVVEYYCEVLRYHALYVHRLMDIKEITLSQEKLKGARNIFFDTLQELFALKDFQNYQKNVNADVLCECLRQEELWLDVKIYSDSIIPSRSTCYLYVLREGAALLLEQNEIGEAMMIIQYLLGNLQRSSEEEKMFSGKESTIQKEKDIEMIKLVVRKVRWELIAAQPLSDVHGSALELIKAHEKNEQHELNFLTSCILHQKKSTKELVALYLASNGVVTKIKIAQELINFHYAEKNARQFFFWVTELLRLIKEVDSSKSLDQNTSDQKLFNKESILQPLLKQIDSMAKTSRGLVGGTFKEWLSLSALIPKIISSENISAQILQEDPSSLDKRNEDLQIGAKQAGFPEGKFTLENALPVFHPG